MSHARRSSPSCVRLLHRAACVRALTSRSISSTGNRAKVASTKARRLARDSRVRRSMDAVQQLARRDHREKRLLSLSTRYPRGHIKLAALIRDQDACIDQDCHGFRSSSRGSRVRASSISAAKSAASAAVSVVMSAEHPPTRRAAGPWAPAAAQPRLAALEQDEALPPIRDPIHVIGEASHDLGDRQRGGADGCAPCRIR